MKHLIAVAAALALAAIPALASEATFDRNLTVNGRVELSVATGSGYVHITRGSGSRLHISGRVRSNWGGSDEKVREIAANPPIEQTGNIVRIGHHENLHNISIDYDIEAPADSYLDATTGSGDITDDGVGENARLNTGSGSIELHNLKGALHAHTGSGNIRVNGSPVSEWKLGTGSGSVDLTVGNTGLTLDASTGSGKISTDHEMTVQGSFDRHHMTGKLNGGGPTVRVETGSGNIEVH